MSVDANQIATKGDLNIMMQRIEQLLQTLPSAATADEYLTLDEVAKATRTSVKTVKKWIDVGKPDSRGNIIRLFALEFSPSYFRVPRAALLAYGQSLGFTVSDLQSVPQMRVAS